MKLCRLAMFILAVGTPLPARAQPLFAHTISLDSFVLNADVVAIGRVVELAAADAQEGSAARVLRLEISHTLKGQHRPRLVIHLANAWAAETWQKSSADLLVSWRGDSPTDSDLFELIDEKVQVMTADLKVLRTRGAVIEAARALIAQNPAVRRVESFNVQVPLSVVKQTTWETVYATGGYLSVEVPADQRLEKRALENVESGDLMLRAEGLRALRFFRSDQNIARARTLLGDTQWAYRFRAQENEGVEVHYFITREAAYETLKYWGVEVPEPVLFEQVDRPEEVTLADQSNRRIDMDKLRNLARFPNLHILVLRNTTIGTEALQVICELKSVTELSLDGTRLTDSQLRSLEVLPNLKYLGLAGTRVTDAGAAEFLKNRPGVQIDR